MNTAFITGIGWVTAAGIGCGKQRKSFQMPKGHLPSLSGKDIFKVPCHRFSRMDPYTQLGLSAISMALRDAALDEWNKKRNMGIIASSTNGCVQTDIQYFATVIPSGGRFASPSVFAYTLPSIFLGEAAIHFGLAGFNFVLCGPFDGGLRCLKLALVNLFCGPCDAVVCGFCDLASAAPYADTGRNTSGALFWVINKAGYENSQNYGALCLSSDGSVFINTRLVKDMAVTTGDLIPSLV